MQHSVKRIGAILLLTGTNALAMGPSPGGQAEGGGFALFVPLLLMVAVLYLFMIRPAQKKQKEKDRMLKALKKGDRIVTTGGIYGEIQQVKDNTVILRVADNVKIEVQRSSVGAIVASKGGDSESEEG